MRYIELDYANVLPFVSAEEIEVQRKNAQHVLKSLRDGTCRGNDFLGWMNLPVEIGEEDLNRVEICARKLRERTDVVVVVGIGGSYLGAKAVIEAMSDSAPAYLEVMPEGERLNRRVEVFISY